jgi:hypothetical protein
MSTAVPILAKKDSKKKKEKQHSSPTITSAVGNNSPIYVAVASTVTAIPISTPMMTDTKGWTTLKVGGQKKKSTTPKLIPTTYPKAEREVICHFITDNTDTISTEQDQSVRQMVADTALCRVNSTFVDTKDVDMPPFIRARVTIHGSIIFTTSNCQNNMVYED